jgi:hypothetical protein
MITPSEENPGPGRPLKFARRPSKQRQRQVELARTAEDAHLQTDAVYAAVKSGSQRRFLEEAVLQAAEEAANVKWERLQRPHDRESPKMSSRRVALLVDVARFLLMLERLNPGRPSLAAGAKVFAAFWALVRETAVQVLTAEESERLMTRCAKHIASPDLAQIDDMFAGEEGRKLAMAMLQAVVPI